MDHWTHFGTNGVLGDLSSIGAASEMLQMLPSKGTFGGIKACPSQTNAYSYAFLFRTHSKINCNVFPMFVMFVN